MKKLLVATILLTACASGTEGFIDQPPDIYSLSVEQIRSNCPEWVNTPTLPKLLQIGQVDLPYYELVNMDLREGCLVHTHLFLGEEMTGFLVKTLDCGRDICQVEAKVQLEAE